MNSDQSAHVDLICDAIEDAEALFDECGMPPLSGPLTTEIVTDLKPGCMGQYHCGKGSIEVLEPSMMAVRRNPKGAFAFLPMESYFQSIIVHELSHGLFDDASCPFEACIVADEYVASVMQVMSLTPEQQAVFSLKSELDRRISRDELNSITLFMVPNVFAQKSWAHLSQRDDPCTYIGKILNGTILLDREHF
ncbi:hypothetical protein [Roseovarius sp. Pro17]|uniref:hypothetical protein n=1 Tax=Roseovarius sp. Pro17 TaxID=3108175 RepID=UPI002D78DC57|nr:hypothetical protein [Roseovarius sp. Pro17]